MAHPMTPGRPPTDTRARLVQGFTRQLVDHGYLGISLGAVADDCGIRKASLYHHFPGGKAELFREVAFGYIDAQEARLSAALAVPGGLAEQLTALAALYTDPRAHAAELGDAVYQATRHLAEDLRSEVSHAYVDRLIAPVTALMARAVADGELAEAEPGFLSWTFLSMASSLTPIPDDLAMPPGERGGPPGPPEPVRAVVRLFLDGARRRPPEEPGH
ncbi:MAG TPA: TetR/AcrR family transcriptional regulator [Kineosporiaceae bacterium]|nr:TetR/AcrR family transcriptional regulator [Kineosporiaceae bacterium]